MSQQLINIGTADQGNGDPIRTAFNKVNENFTELFEQVSASVVVDTTPPAAPSEGNLWWDPEGGRLYISYDANWIDASPVDGVGISETNELVNGTHTVSLGSDGTVTFPDSLTVANSVIGKSSSTTISEETPGGTISETTEIESQIEIATTGIVIAKRTRIIVDDTVTTSTDEAGSTLTVNSSTASIKHYVEPDGPNNGSYFQVSTSNVGAVLEGVNETLNGTDYGRVLAVQNAVTIGTSVEGVAKYWLFDYLGGLTLPTPTSQVFTVTFDSNHYTPTVGKPSLELTSEPWQLEGQVIYEQNGTASLQLTNIWPTLVNPGYDSGDAFTFSTLVHGLSDYTLTITLNDVVLPGGAGWTANVAVSQLPAYPSNILANGAIKLTAGNESFIFGGDGSLHFPDGSFQGTAFVGLASTAQDLYKNGEIFIGIGDGVTTTQQWSFGTDGGLTFPDSTVQTTAVSLDQLEVDGTTILTLVDESIAIQTGYRPTVSAVAASGSGPDTFVTDISEDDDIIVVDTVTWEVNIGDEEANWVPVTSVVVDPGVTCTIGVSGFEFIQGTSYTFRNNEQVDSAWTFRDIGTIAGPGGVILSNETYPLGGGGTYRELAIELPTADGQNDQRWVFDNDGDFTTPGNITVTGGLLTTYGSVVDVAVNADNYLGLHANPNAGVLVRSSDTELNYSDWKFEVGGSLTLPQYNFIESVGSNATISLNGVASNESIIELATRVDGEMITSVFAMAPAYGIQLTSVRTVDITAGYDSATFKWDAWQAAEQDWTDIRDQDAATIAPDTRPWAGMPSYEAYNEILLYTAPPGVLPQPDSLVVIANTAKAAYELWQAEQAAINVTITAKDQTWTFGNDGSLTVPGNSTIKGQDNTDLYELGGSLIFEGGLGGVQGQPGNILIGTNSGSHRTSGIQIGSDDERNTVELNGNVVFLPNATVDFQNVSVSNLSNIGSEGNINIDINLSDSTLRRWTFGTDGSLTIPGDIVAEFEEDLTISTSYTAMASPPGPATNLFTFGANGTLTVPGLIVGSNITVRSADSTSTSIENGVGGHIEIGYQADAGNIYIGTSGTDTTTHLYSDKLRITAEVPGSSKGASGDLVGLVAFNSSYIYYCTGTYDGVTDIWKRVALTGGTW